LLAAIVIGFEALPFVSPENVGSLDSYAAPHLSAFINEVGQDVFYGPSSTLSRDIQATPVFREQESLIQQRLSARVASAIANEQSSVQSYFDETAAMDFKRDHLFTQLGFGIGGVGAGRDNVRITEIEIDSKTGDYAANLQYTIIDSYQFDDDDARNGFLLAGAAALQASGDATPFVVTVVFDRTVTGNANERTEPSERINVRGIASGENESPYIGPSLDRFSLLSVAGRQVRANPDGGFTIGNIPVGAGQPEIRNVNIRWERDGVRYYGRFGAEIARNVTTEVDLLDEEFLLRPTPFPELTVIDTAMVPRTLGAARGIGSVAINIPGQFSDGSMENLIESSLVQLQSTNESVLSVSDDRSLVANGLGTAFLTMTSEGLSATVRIDVVAATREVSLVGTLQLPDGAPAVAAEITTAGFGGVATSDQQGAFELRVTLPTEVEEVTVRASLGAGEGALSGSSGPLEIVAAGTIDAGIITLDTQQSGSLFPGQRFPTGGDNPRNIISGDWNQDGRLDVATTNTNDDFLSILLGRGDGTFDPALTRFAGRSPRDLVNVDIDRDGIDDVVLTNAFDDEIRVLFGREIGRAHV
jgi:hypothetical protein